MGIIRITLLIVVIVTAAIVGIWILRGQETQTPRPEAAPAQDTPQPVESRASSPFATPKPSGAIESAGLPDDPHSAPAGNTRDNGSPDEGDGPSEEFRVGIPPDPDNDPQIGIDPDPDNDLRVGLPPDPNNDPPVGVPPDSANDPPVGIPPGPDNGPPVGID